VFSGTPHLQTICPRNTRKDAEVSEAKVDNGIGLVLDNQFRCFFFRVMDATSLTTSFGVFRGSEISGHEHETKRRAFEEHFGKLPKGTRQQRVLPRIPPHRCIYSRLFASFRFSSFMLRHSLFMLTCRWVFD
jgi:hypothetical protein